MSKLKSNARRFPVGSRAVLLTSLQGDHPSEDHPPLYSSGVVIDHVCFMAAGVVVDFGDQALECDPGWLHPVAQAGSRAR